MSSLPLKPMVLLAGLAAALIAATQTPIPPGWSVAAVYAYWFVRIAIEAAVIIAGLHLIASSAAHPWKRALAALGVALATLVPFVLAVTAMDIILGLPELEQLEISSTQGGLDVALAPDPSAVGDRLTVFLFELFYLLDNHLVLTCIVAVPWIMQAAPQASAETPANDHERAPIVQGQLAADPAMHSAPAAVLTLLEPPFDDTLLRAEAQEHYVRLVGASQTRMVLLRFNDLVRQLPETMGMRVHRSHWVSTDAVEQLYRDGNNLRLRLKDGTSVPVSRRNARKAEALFQIKA
ncbi:LytTR family DNA-binding domain-containing protein [Roseibium sp.]|uniref:LytTR family DNA-binding domain-containing protein n=1 Tax=Roseibium sp. TaxID=1936156 RepID=UPI003A972BA0